MFDKAIVIGIIFLLSAPAASAIMAPTGMREKAKEIRQENVEQRKLMNETFKTTGEQMREDYKKMWESLKATSAVEMKSLKVTGYQEWQYLQKRRLEEIEKSKADGQTEGELQEINKKYVELGKSLRATYQPQRKEMIVTKTQERKTLRTTIVQERKMTIQENQLTRSTFQEQVKNSWKNFFGMFGPKPTVTAAPETE